MTSYAAVVTNGHLRPLVEWRDLPDSAKAEFDYMDETYEEPPRFVWAYGGWHDVGDAQRILVAPRHYPTAVNVHESSPLAGWDAITTTSHWSGTVFRYPTEEEAGSRLDRWDYIIVGRYVA